MSPPPQTLNTMLSLLPHLWRAKDTFSGSIVILLSLALTSGINRYYILRFTHTIETQISRLCDVITKIIQLGTHTQREKRNQWFLRAGHADLRKHTHVACPDLASGCVCCD